MRWLIALLVLAGCAGPESRVPAELDEPGPFDAPPPWAIGDYWRIESGGGSWRYIVTGETGPDWIMDTDNPNTAFFDALTDISTLGPQRKSDLAGSQGSDRVRFFQWPLMDGATWTTRWDGEDMLITAHVGADVAHMQAKVGDALRVEYTYKPSLRWLGSMTFYDVNGTQQFAMTVAEAGHNATGQAVRAELAIYSEGSFTGPVAENGVLPDPPASTDLYLDIRFECPQGVALFALGPTEAATTLVTNAEAPGYSIVGPCPEDVAEALVVAEAPYAADWGRLVDLPPGASLEYTLWARTFTPIELG